MTNYRVDVDGTTATKVIDVDYEKTTGGDIGQANITVGNTQTNRNLFAPAAVVEVFYEDPNNAGSYVKDWVGEVIGNPSNKSKRNLTLEVEAETKVAQVEYGKVNRPFIEMDSGAILREAIDKTVEPYTRPKYVHRGDDLSNWSSDATYFELGEINSKGLNEYGRDVFFFGLKEGQSGTFEATYDAVSFSEAPGGRILKAETRMLVANQGNVISGEIELVDDDGNSYVWELEIPGYGGFETYELPVEDAEVNGSSAQLSGSGKLEYRFSVDGGLPEDRAIAIDMFRTTPFALNDRGTAISTSGIEDTGRVITRRVDDSILSLAETLSQEDGAVFYVDESDVAHYETAGDTHVDPSLNIDSSTTIVDVDVDRDFDVRNRVTVQGKGDLQATFEDSSSIEFYNTEAPKEEPIIDKSLRTRDQLETRARGFLRDKAWEDTAVEFTIGDAAYRDVTVGQAIDVTWSPEDIDGTFTISKVGSTPEGYVVIGLTGNTSA